MASAKPKKAIFPWLYGALTLCLAAGCAVILLYVHSLLREYEACQPETAVLRTAAELESRAAAGTLWEFLPRPGENRTRFDTGESLWDTYQQELAAGGLTAVRRTGSFQENTLSFVLRQGERAVAVVDLRCTNTRTRFLVFTFSDWTVTGITPLSASYSCSYVFRLPEGFTATVNGLLLADTELTGDEGGVRTYEIRDMAAEPVIAVTDPFGADTAYNVTGGVLTPVTHTLDLSVPEGLSVLAWDTLLQPAETTDGLCRYHVAAGREPELRLTDAYGGEARYEDGMVLTGGSRSVTVPEGFRVRVGTEVLDPAGAVLTVNPDFPEGLPYAEDLPGLYRYTFVILDGTPVVLVAPDGTETVPEHPDGTEIRSLPDTAGAPETDVLAAARAWSLFMTNDLVGELNGFYRMAAYLLPDSYLYQVARKWATGVDITLTSIHSLKNPPFGNEQLSHYVRYSDRLFSCDVFLEKYMVLYYGAPITDVMQSRLWFAKTDSGWKLCAIQDLTAKGETA